MPQQKRQHDKRGLRNPRTNQRNRPQPLLQMRAVRTAGHQTPPEVIASVLLTQRMELFQVCDGILRTPVLTTDVVGLLPGGTSGWSSFRIVAIEAWGNDNLTTLEGSGSITLELAPSPLSADIAQFYDTGTYGAERAHISVRPSTLYSMYWWPTGTGVPFMYVSSTQSGELITIHVTVEVRSVLLYQ